MLDNLSGLTISCDGRPETQDRQRPFVGGLGSSRAVLKTLQTLDRSGFSYGLRLTATPPWRGELAKDIRFLCENTGCQAMQVEPAFNTQRGAHRPPTVVESHAFVEAFMEAFEVASAVGRSLTYSGARPWLLACTFCTAPYGALIVNPSGELVACYEVTDEGHPLAEMSRVGRVVDGQVQVDNDARSSLLAQLAGRRAACRDCFCYWHCAGDCYSRGIPAAPGAPGPESPRCIMNRGISARLLLWYIMRDGGLWRGQGAHPQSDELMKAF
jgi:uncharacterized protein